MRISRRDFLAASAAVTLPPVIDRGLNRLLAADAQSYGPLNVGAQSYSFREFPLERALKQYQALGLKYAEFFNKHIPLNSTPAQIAAY